MMLDVTIKPCPFCGGSEQQLKRSQTWGRFVSCACHAVGPSANNAYDAIVAWNTRKDAGGEREPGGYRPCPFCGGRRQRPKHSQRWGYFVSCSCHATGPTASDRYSAAVAWDTRKEPMQGVLDFGRMSDERGERRSRWANE